MPLVTAGQQPVFADDHTSFQAFYQTNLDFRRIVVLPLEARRSITATQQASARVLDAKFANQSISIQTEAPAPSLVVVSQTYYPAWRAYMDGQPTKIWRANYAFQALEVPAGRHQIRMVYEDKKFLVGQSFPASDCWPVPGSGCSLIFPESGRGSLRCLILRSVKQTENISAVASHRVGPDATGDWLSLGRFALGLAVLIFAAFPQVLLGLQTFVVRDFGSLSSRWPITSANASGTGSCLCGTHTITAACRFWRSGTPCRYIRPP